MDKQPELFEHIPSLSFRVGKDFINLEQDTGCGEVERVDIHRLHLGYIATKARIFDARNEQLAERLLRLRDEIADLVDELASVPCFPPSDSETDDVVQVRRLLALADKFCDDLNDKEEI